MLDVRGEKYRIESRIFRLRGLGAARRAFNAILANVRLRGMCVLADDPCGDGRVGGELHFFGTSPPAQQLRVVTTNLGDGDERKTEAKVRGGEEGNGEQEEVLVEWLSDACVARSVRLRVVLHGIRGRQSWYLHGAVVMQSNSQRLALPITPKLSASHKSQVTQRSRPTSAGDGERAVAPPLPSLCLSSSAYFWFLNEILISYDSVLTRAPWPCTLGPWHSNDLDDWGTRKSPEQGRAHKAAIGVGSQKCYRAGGQTRMAQVTTRLCLSNAWSNPARLAQKRQGFGERRYDGSFDWSAHRTSNNR
ncbi:hypothetical protein NA56DRAFT_711842 [Hyaloscypha hepaticicola]|uniref:Uncharacterized protein n=1 Tax=Hyaloscypha hepaticicola TaxID=2082293 RepID=A0A2J6PHZ7_9HELO|nr:hypothetical protein NA56DRAFT_711842 [Hyaloscypha hepaticicola]